MTEVPAAPQQQGGGPAGAESLPGRAEKQEEHGAASIHDAQATAAASSTAVQPSAEAVVSAVETKEEKLARGRREQRERLQRRNIVLAEDSGELWQWW